MNKKIVLVVIILIIICLLFVIHFNDGLGIRRGVSPMELGNNTISYPYGFSLIDSTDTAVNLVNSQDERIYIQLLSENSLNSYNNRLASINSNSTQDLIENKTVEVDGVEVYLLTFSFINERGLNNLTSAYFTKNNDNYYIDMWNFELADKDLTESRITQIIHNMS